MVLGRKRVGGGDRKGGRDLDRGIGRISRLSRDRERDR